MGGRRGARALDLTRLLMGPGPDEGAGRPWPVVVVVAALLAVSWMLALFAGGAGIASPMWFLLPVLLAALRLHWYWGLGAALVAGFLAGPLTPLFVHTAEPQAPGAWLVRAGIFVLVSGGVSWVVYAYRDIQVRLRSTQKIVQAMESDGTQRVVSRKEYEGGRRRIERILRGDDLYMAFQPIVNMRTGETSGYEALSRFDAKPKRPPNEWFAEAWEVGLGVDLEIKAVQQVLRDIRRLPQGYVSFNLSPLAVLSPQFKQLIPKLPYGRFVLEMTEHVPVPDYDELIGFLSELRMRGLRIAVDDAGAGYASFRHILRLSPDLIKLDMSLVRGVDRDQALRSLTAAVTGFAAQMGALVVAEGVETEGELLALRKIGVQYGQGWDLFGEPKPVQEVRRVIRTMPEEDLHLSSLDIERAVPPPAR